jgi:hypothetical protein
MSYPRLLGTVHQTPFNNRPIRVLSQAWSMNFVGSERYLCLDEGLVARAWNRYLRWTESKAVVSAMYADALACGIDQGNFFHWWMLGWWIFQPLRLLDKIAWHVDAQVLRGGR